MKIRFRKDFDKPDTMTCLRDDGSLTFAMSTVGTRHDLIHYAVESVLGFQNAFFGLVAQGRDIDSFGTRNGQKDSYPDEALFAELLVGILQWPAIHGTPQGRGDFAFLGV